MGGVLRSVFVLIMAALASASPAARRENLMDNTKGDLGSHVLYRRNSKCLADGNWPTSEPGDYTLACLQGQTGTRTRRCAFVNGQAVWEDEVNTCAFGALECARDGDWITTASGNTRSLQCPEGMSGSKTRKCSDSGQWEDVVVDCQYTPCDQDGLWSQTNPSVTISVDCNLFTPRMINKATRKCSDKGTWEAPDISKCAWPNCVENGMWSETAPGLTATASCPQFQLGQLTRACSDKGVWGQADSSACDWQACEASGAWERSESGVARTIACPAGMLGTRTRTCFEGQWQSEDVSQCSWPACETDGVWESVASGKYSYAPCPGGHTGQGQRQCVTGAWRDPDFTRCTGGEQPVKRPIAVLTIELPAENFLPFKFARDLSVSASNALKIEVDVVKLIQNGKVVLEKQIVGARRRRENASPAPTATPKPVELTTITAHVNGINVTADEYVSSADLIDMLDKGAPAIAQSFGLKQKQVQVLRSTGSGNEDSSSGSSSMVYVYAGVVAGAILLLGVVLIMYVARRRKERDYLFARTHGNSLFNEEAMFTGYGNPLGEHGRENRTSAGSAFEMTSASAQSTLRTGGLVSNPLAGGGNKNKGGTNYSNVIPDGIPASSNGTYAVLAEDQGDNYTAVIPAQGDDDYASVTPALRQQADEKKRLADQSHEYASDEYASDDYDDAEMQQ